MLNVPFQAMYTAKQYIAELTIYSFIQTVLRTGFIYYMVTHPADWLVGYGIGMLFVTAIPALLICFRACMVFPECRFRPCVVRQLWRVTRLGSFAMWQGVGGLGYIASNQGMTILVNNMFGTQFIGGYSVAQTVGNEAASLTGALQGAFSPAITSAFGEGNMARMKSLAFNACRYGTLLTMMFAIPMSLEINTILRIWLKTPPPCAAEMCVCIMAFITIEKLSIGHQSAVNASGRVARFQTYRGLLRISVIPLALLACYFKLGLTATMLSLPVSAIIVASCDVWLARTRVGMSAWVWVKSVVLPLFYSGVAAFSIGWIVSLMFPQSFLRLICSTVLSLLTLASASWFIILSEQERRMFIHRLKKMLKGKISANL